MNTRTALLISVSKIASMILAYGDRSLPLDKEARSALDNAYGELVMLRAWDDEAREEADAT